LAFARLLVWAWGKVGVLAVEAARADIGWADAQLKLQAVSEMGVTRQTIVRLDPAQQPRTRWRSASRPGSAACI